MKKFKFSLEAVLKWKRAQEEAALKILGEAMRVRQLAFETLQTARRHMGELLKAIREARQAPNGMANSAQMQVVYNREIARQEANCKNCEELLGKSIAQEEVAREAYLIRRKEAEAIQKLGEKRKNLHEVEANRRLELELEEIVLSKR